MAITVGTPIVRRDGTFQVSISQSAAGADEVIQAAPPAGMRVALVALYGAMSVTGTVKLISGNTDLTGAIDVVAGTPLDWRGNSHSPLLECAKAESLEITTTLGAFRGYAILKIVV